MPVEEYYTGLDEKLRGIWQMHGSQGFLHHAHAVFGYPAFEGAVAFAQDVQPVGDQFVLLDIGGPGRVDLYRKAGWGPPRWR